MSSLRDLIAALLALLGAVLLGAALPAVWLQQHVVDEDGFVAIAGPVGSDPEVRDQLSDEAASRITEDSSLPAWAQDRLDPLVQEQVDDLSESDVYQRVWVSSMRELHQQLFSPGPTELSVDLTPVASAITDPIEKTLPVEIPVPDDLDVTIATIPRIALLEKSSLLDPWAGRMLPAGIVCAAVALLIARHRRAILVLEGIAGMAAGGLLLFALHDLEGLVPDAVDQLPLLGSVVQAFEDQLAADVRPQAIFLAGVSTLVMAVGIVLMGLRRRS